MNKDEIRLKFDGWKIRYETAPTAAKVFIGITLGAILIAVLYYFVAPQISSFFADWRKSREYQHAVKDLREDSHKHESNADALGNRRQTLEKDWVEFQPVREAAEAQADQSKQNLEGQEGEYKNATNGNVNIDPHLTLRQRRARVLARDRADYPEGGGGGGAQPRTVGNASSGNR